MSKFELVRLENEESTPLEEVARHYQAEVERYAEYLKEFNGDPEALKAEEEYTIKIQEEHEAFMAKFKGYKLPNGITYEKEKYTKEQIVPCILQILEKQEVAFSMTLGYLQTYNFWKIANTKTRVPHNILNSTLNILGSGIKFKGPEEWQAIILIDAYFAKVSGEFRLNLVRQLIGTSLHDAVLKEMQLYSPNPTGEQDQQ